MGLGLSCAVRSWRKTKRRNQKEGQPDLSLQAALTQIEESASAATQFQDKEQHEEQHEEQHGEHHDEQHEEQYQSASQVMGLPLDVIVMIFDLLEIHDAVAFSLACKGLHDHLFADARALLKKSSREDKLKVQTMLEKDLPYDQIYCFFCRTFHTLHKDYLESKCAGKDKPHMSLFATYVPGKKTSMLRYVEARAAMNAVLFKRPLEEVALKWLDRRCQSGTGDDIWYQFWKPKIIGGELLLQVSASRTRKNTIRDKDEFAYSACKHVHIHGKFPHLWVHNSELRWMCIFTDRKRAAGTCRTCRTDWKLHMEWVFEEGVSSARAGWDVFIQSWHRFGTLRSPSDPLWALCAGEERSPKTTWIEGDSAHIIDHDGWELQYSRTRTTLEDCGPAERMWVDAEENEVL